MRDHFGRERALVAGPAHISLHAFAERLLGNADLQRAEARIASDLRGDNLVDGWAAGAATGEIRSGHQTTHRICVAIALTGRRRVIGPAQYVDILAPGSDWREAGGHVVIRAFRLRNPVTLGDTIPVKPQYKPGFDRLCGAFACGGVRRAGRIEHRNERWQTNNDPRAGGRHSFEQRPARSPNAVCNYLR